MNEAGHAARVVVSPKTCLIKKDIICVFVGQPLSLPGPKMIQFFVYLLNGAWIGFQVFSLSLVGVIVICHFLDIIALLKRLALIYPVSRDTSRMTLKTQSKHPLFIPNNLCTESAKWLNYSHWGCVLWVGGREAGRIVPSIHR